MKIRMKRVVLSAVLIVAAICYSIFSAWFAVSESREIKQLTLQIEELNTAYIATGDGIIQAEALSMSEELERLAEHFENAVSLFVRDERLSSLEYSAARVRHLIRFGSDEVSAELESIREQVETIAEGEQPFWYNIL
jgi:2-methylisocitrate lyase-like PEP mutase family enzyme